MVENSINLFIKDYEDLEVLQNNNLEERLKKFIKENDIIEYDFSYEYTKFDTEQSILSKLIWKILFSIYYQDKLSQFLIKENERFSTCILSNKNNVDANDFTFDVYYDVMNNNKSIRDEYHRIGNYSVYPRMDKRPQLQNIHKYFNEQWDKLLFFLQTNWENKEVIYTTVKGQKVEYKQEKSFQEKWGNLNFKEYMILTCQPIYYKEIWEEISLQPKEIHLETIEDWNANIRNKEYELLTVEYNNPEMVKKLISIRGEIIKVLLTEK